MAPPCPLLPTLMALLPWRMPWRWAPPQIRYTLWRNMVSVTKGFVWCIILALLFLIKFGKFISFRLLLTL